MSTDKYGFCPLCDVTLDLHDGPDSCEEAQNAVARLERLERLMFGGFVR